ncbi:uncharacterized protein LOC108329231 isoform X9 [Vigna angularis]|uniref:uncharacterized protein LOC108329231 isoform X9 n=1 Tax=Phaseolus angularis TaxID=3914 RepID=UPI0022B5DC00|nr:uncharacterized protein LOC108329231 isoform X9 [Vigna angularis]
MVVGSCTLTSNTKRRATYKFSTDMDTEAATKQIKLDALKERAGREIRVFETYVSSSSNSALSNEEVTDDFYEFTAEDYHRLLAAKKEDKFLKTRKIREAEEAARRSEMTKDLATGKTILTAKEQSGLYFLEFDDQSNTQIMSQQATSETWANSQIWLHHQRLGHPSFSLIKSLFPHLFTKESVESFNCDICQLSKHHRASYPISNKKSISPFDLIHSDVWVLS